MIDWLVDLGFTTTGDYAIVTYMVAGCLTIGIVLIIVSMLMGVATNIFRK